MTMSDKVGIWIDRKKAIIVSLTDSGEKIEEIESNIGGKPHPKGGSPSKTPYGPQDAVAEDRLQRNFEQALSRYFDKVITNVKDAQALYICGPGQAKIGFRKRIERKAPAINIVGVEAMDKMSNAQVKDAVRHFFQA